MEPDAGEAGVEFSFDLGREIGFDGTGAGSGRSWERLLTGAGSGPWATASPAETPSSPITIKRTIRRVGSEAPDLTCAASLSND